MKILKFGGTSVANAESLQSVISIVKSQKQKTVVVVSALGGITNLLIDLLEQAAKKDSSYLDGIDTIRQRHMEPVESYLAKKDQKNIITFLDDKLIQLENLLQSVFQLEEITERTLSKVSSLGEILSAKLISAFFTEMGIDHHLHNPTQLIATQTKNGKIVVDFEKSKQQTDHHFEATKESIHLVSVYIAGNESG